MAFMSTVPLIAGSMHGYAKNLEQYHKFQERKQNPALEKADEKMEKRMRDLDEIRRRAKETQEANKITALDAKLLGGATLTQKELDYLREKSPDLYKKAIEIQKERKKYKEELKKCRTKEDVERVQSNKMQTFVSEVNTVKGNPNIPEGKKEELLRQICRRCAGIMSEYAAFIQSERYSQLPAEEEIRKGKKKPLKEEVEEQHISAKEIMDDVRQLLNVSSQPEGEILQPTINLTL